MRHVRKQWAVGAVALAATLGASLLSGCAPPAGSAALTNALEAFAGGGPMVNETGSETAVPLPVGWAAAAAAAAAAPPSFTIGRVTMLLT